MQVTINDASEPKFVGQAQAVPPEPDPQSKSQPQPEPVVKKGGK